MTFNDIPGAPFGVFDGDFDQSNPSKGSKKPSKLSRTSRELADLIGINDIRTHTNQELHQNHVSRAIQKLPDHKYRRDRMSNAWKCRLDRIRKAHGLPLSGEVKTSRS